MRAEVTGLPLSHYSAVLWLMVICMYIQCLRRLNLAPDHVATGIIQHLLTS